MPAQRRAPGPSKGCARFGAGRPLLALAGLALTLAGLAPALAGLALTLAGCKDPLPQKVGQSCGGDYGGCAQGLRCSFKKKRCYRPVDCAHLDRRMKACLAEVVSAYAPLLAKLPAQKRTRLLERIGQHLKTEVVDHCKYDAAAYQKKHSTEPTKTKSYGEDPRAKELAACLHKQRCRPFAKCLLGLARVVGPERPSPEDPPVFPIGPPRPGPAAKPDAGAPNTGMGAVKPAMDATKPAMDAAKPAMDAAKPAMDAAKPAKDATKPAILPGL